MAEGTTDTIFETEGLTKEFGGFIAVKDVSLRVKRGTIHALIGPNGAGKTTCFNSLTKFLPPTRGAASLTTVATSHGSCRPTWRVSGSFARSRYRRYSRT